MSLDKQVNNIPKIQYITELMFLAGMPIKDADTEHFSIEYQSYKDRYKVCLGGNGLFIDNAFEPKFWLLLKQESFNEVIDILNNEKDNRLYYKPIIGLDKIILKEDDGTDPFLQTCGEDFDRVDARISGLVSEISKSINLIGNLTNTAMETVRKDTNIIKDFDGYVSFDSPMGGEFNLGMCFDKIAPVDEEKNVINRTPMTKEDFDLYMGDCGPRITNTIDHINKMVRNFLESKVVTWNESVTYYAHKALDIVVLKAFLDWTVEFITFGGVDDWRVNGPDTPNNKACFAILDQEVEYIINYLENIPLQEGVDLYSIDIDTYTIFGRNNMNKVVTPIIQGHSEGILSRYSKGFESVLSIRMGMSDNAHFFKA